MGAILINMGPILYWDDFHKCRGRLDMHSAVTFLKMWDDLTWTWSWIGWKTLSLIRKDTEILPSIYLHMYLWCWLEKGGRWPISQVFVTSSNMTTFLYTMYTVKSQKCAYLQVIKISIKIIIFCSCCSATVVELSEFALKFLTALYV